MPSQMRTVPSLLCGAHATYVTLGLMEDSNRNIHEIMKAYPAITHSGISLNV